MDYSTTKEVLAFNETVFEGCSEQPIDLDFNLPDYCPDIQKILKCQINPKISMRNVSGDRLDIEGVVVVSLLYLDSENSAIRCCEHAAPFIASFNLKLSPQNPSIHTKIKVEYINCRALSSRRLDIHGAFSVCAEVKENWEQEIVNGVDGQGIELKKEYITAQNLNNMAQQTFSINETIDLNKGKVPIEAVIKCSQNISLSDYKVLENKVIANAVANFKILYLGNLETGSIEVFEYAMPISQMIDVEGADENSLCEVNLEILNCEAVPRADASGENTLLDIEFKLVASASCFNKKEVALLTDAYSTNYEMELKYSNTNLPLELENINDIYSVKNAIELNSSGLSRIIDISGEIAPLNIIYDENGKMHFKGKLNVSVLALDDEEIPFYTERLLDFDYEKDFNMKDSNTKCECSANLVSIGYRIIGNGEIEVHAEIKINGVIYRMKMIRSICDVILDEEKPKIKDTDSALVVYYADKGESLWDIARKYCTSVEMIKNENDIEEDTLSSRGMILIR